MKILFFFIRFLPFLIQVLENNIRFVWLLNHQHLYLLWPFLDNFREGNFTKLTLEFSEINCHSNSKRLLLHLTLNPDLQAINVNQLAGSFAVTRRYQKVVVSAFITQTELTCSIEILSHSMNSILFSKMVSFSDWICSVMGSALYDQILHSSHLDCVSRC